MSFAFVFYLPLKVHYKTNNFTANFCCLHSKVTCEKLLPAVRKLFFHLLQLSFVDLPQVLEAEYDQQYQYSLFTIS